MRVTLPTLHSDQRRALALKIDDRRGDWDANAGGRFKAVRCGRRWGKSKLGETWVGDGALKGEPCGWFAPDYKRLSEVYAELKIMLAPVTSQSSKTDGVIRLDGGGRIDFWTLEDESAGRSRMYKRAFMDEGAFTKANMIDIWRESILPTLFDLHGFAMVGSNTNGNDPENFLYQVCNDPKYGFIDFHAPTINNPTIPMLRPGETEAQRTARRFAEIERIRSREHPLVFLQEYRAEFVDWSGVAFFSLDSLLLRGQPVPFPAHCDAVYAVIDSATKTGTANDGTAVTYFALCRIGYEYLLVVLDWDIIQIEGALLETWLPTVLENTEAYARQCGARAGSIGAFIEDKDSGQILLQQAQNRGLPATPIDGKLTSHGKDGRAISVSGYVYRGEVKLSQPAYDKVTVFKGVSRNHLVSQVTGFRIGDKDAAKRADDLLDTFVYGVAIGLGDSEGF